MKRDQPNVQYLYFLECNPVNPDVNCFPRMALFFASYTLLLYIFDALYSMYFYTYCFSSMKPPELSFCNQSDNKLPMGLELGTECFKSRLDQKYK